MRSICRFALLALAVTFALSSPSAAGDEDAAAIRDVVNRAYVDGIHRQPDRAAIEAGFHPDFVMLVSSDGELIQVSLDMWLERMTFDGKPRPEKVEAEFTSIDVTGDTATARLEVTKDGKHIYTDYFGFYRFEDGWKIVNKIFQSHD